MIPDTRMIPESRMIHVRSLGKTFVLHNQGGIRLPVFSDLELHVDAGECLALSGPSGSGKSTLLRSLYGNYAPSSGEILIRHRGELLDIATAGPRAILQVRAETVGYVSQFLRVIPRVGALEIVAGALGARRGDAAAREKARALLERLHIPQELHELSPMTFSGGEQQRVNIARGLIRPMDVLLLDEPTASLDPANREVVIELILEAKGRGAAVVGIFHDKDAQARVADRVFTLTPTNPSEQAA